MKRYTSAAQSGYKIVGPFTVQTGTLSDLVLDFNACKSVVVAGKSGKYLLKPVVTAMAQLVSGSISGTTVAGSQIYAENASSVIVTGTVADGTGAFKLSPILGSSLGGNIDVVIAPPALAFKATYIVQNIPVTAGADTSLGTISPASSTINSISGTVTVGGSLDAANIVADQTVTSGVPKTYEIGTMAETSGSYSMPLAAAGPYLGAYNTTLPIIFAQDTASAVVGVYSITATDASGVSATQTVSVSSVSATADFTF